MAYGDLYQRRRTAPPQQPMSVPQPVNESFVEHQRRLHPVSLDATTGAGWSERELAEAREWRRLYTGRLLGFGVSIPNKYLAFACDGAAPQNAPFALDAASDPKTSIARQINENTSLRASLATDTPVSRRDLATDGPQHRPTMSYKLKQVFGDYDWMTEEALDESMLAWGVTEPRDRIGLKTEAMALGIMRPRGQAPKLPARYIQAPHVNDPKNQHFIDKKSPAATKDTGGRPDTPGRKHGLTMQACDSQGFACYDGTGINLL